MHKRLKYIFILLFLFSFAKTQDTTFYCDPWFQQDYGAYVIEDNFWGKGNINNFS